MFGCLIKSKISFYSLISHQFRLVVTMEYKMGFMFVVAYDLLLVKRKEQNLCGHYIDLIASKKDFDLENTCILIKIETYDI